MVRAVAVELRLSGKASLVATSTRYTALLSRTIGLVWGERSDIFLYRSLTFGVLAGSVVHVDAERLILPEEVNEVVDAERLILPEAVNEVADDVGETALDDDRDDAGVRDLDEMDVVD